MTVRSKMRGITLVELLTVVVIVGILASIAVPSYRNYVMRTQRTDATAALLRLAAAQEKFYLQNNTYTTDVTAAGLNLTAAAPLTSEHGWYTVTVAAADATGYSAAATPVAGGAQASDTHCTSFSIDETGKRGATNTDCWR